MPHKSVSKEIKKKETFKINKYVHKNSAGAAVVSTITSSRLITLYWVGIL